MMLAMAHHLRRMSETEDELARGVDAATSTLEYSSCPRFQHVFREGLCRRGGSSDDFLGDRFWGQVQGFSGTLKALRVGVRQAEELAVMQGKRTSKRCSLAV
jgi:hypothetical protein